MKFDMGSSTLADLGKSTVGSTEDLGTLIRWLVQAAEPLEEVQRGGEGRVRLVQVAHGRDYGRAERVAGRDPGWPVRHGHRVRLR